MRDWIQVFVCGFLEKSYSMGDRSSRNLKAGTIEIALPALSNADGPGADGLVLV
jgi:hypothetical protein